MTWYKVETVWTGLAGSPGYTALWIDKALSASPALAADAVSDFWDATKGARHTSIKANMVSEVVEYNTPSDPIAWHEATAPSILGTSADQLLPPITHMLMRWRTAAVTLGGRRLQGHTFIPGYTEVANGAGGVPDTGIRTTHETAGAALMTRGLAIASRALNEFIPVTAAATWGEWATLASRRD